MPIPNTNDIFVFQKSIYMGGGGSIRPITEDQINQRNILLKIHVKKKISKNILCAKFLYKPQVYGQYKLGGAAIK